MSNDPDIRVLQATFNRVCSSLFQEAYNTFRNDVAALVRNRDENVYQLLRSKHTARFRQLLHQHATNVIAECKASEMQIQLHAKLSESIRYFEGEFVRKTDEY